jgi:hypothetical protein
VLSGVSVTSERPRVGALRCECIIRASQTSGGVKYAAEVQSCKVCSLTVVYSQHDTGVHVPATLALDVLLPPGLRARCFLALILEEAFFRLSVTMPKYVNSEAPLKQSKSNLTFAGAVSLSHDISRSS